MIGFMENGRSNREKVSFADRSNQPLGSRPFCQKRLNRQVHTSQAAPRFDSTQAALATETRVGLGIKSPGDLMGERVAALKEVEAD